MKLKSGEQDLFEIGKTYGIVGTSPYQPVKIKTGSGCANINVQFNLGLSQNKFQELANVPIVENLCEIISGIQSIYNIRQNH